MKKFSPNNLRRFAVMLALSLLFFAAIAAAAVLLVGAENWQAALAKLQPQHVLWVVGLSLLNYAFRGARWPLAAKAMGLKVPLPQMALFYVAGFTFVPTPGKVGTALRLWLLKRHYNIAYRRSAPLMVMDQLTDLIAMALLCLGGIGVVAGHGSAVVFMGLAFGALVVLLAKPKWALCGVKVLYGMLGKRKPRLFAAIQHIIKQTAVLFGFKVLLATVSLAVVGWVFTAAAIWLVLADLQPKTVAPLEAAFSIAFATMAGFLSMLPGGLGGAEATMTAVLKALGVTLPIAVAVTFLVRGILLWFAVALGAMALPFVLRRKQTQ